MTLINSLFLTFYANVRNLFVNNMILSRLTEVLNYTSVLQAKFVL